MLFQSFQNSFKHEINENARIGFRRAVIYGLIIIILVVMNNGLDREMQKYRIQFAKDKRLPKPSCPAISISEWVDEFKFVMKYATPNQQMIFGIAKPAKEIGDQLWNLPGRRRDVYKLLSCKDTNAASSKTTCTIHK